MQCFVYVFKNVSLRDDDDKNLPGLVEKLERDKECEQQGNGVIM